MTDRIDHDSAPHAAATSKATARDRASYADRLLTCLSAGVLSGIVAAIALAATMGDPADAPGDAPGIATVIPTVYSAEPATATDQVPFEHLTNR